MKTTNFHYGNKLGKEFVVNKYFSDFYGIVSPFGFRIYIVENVGSKFYRKLIVKSTKLFKRFLLEWPMYLFKLITDRETF